MNKLQQNMRWKEVKDVRSAVEENVKENTSENILEDIEEKQKSVAEEEIKRIKIK